MEGIMKKATELYGALQMKSAELKAKESELNGRGETSAKYKASLDAREAELVKEEKRVKRVADVIDAETLLAARSAEVDLAVANLAKAREKFQEEQAAAEKAIAKRDKDSQDIAAETLATRQRLLVEVKRVEEMKAKYKEEVLAQLKGM